MSNWSKMSDGYPFFFLMKEKETENISQLCTLIYRFKSFKSNHSYIVRVEVYKENVYCLKFYDKAVSESINRYSIRSNTFEPRTIMYTIYRIMLDVLKKDDNASFFFIGAEDEKDEIGGSTRRYRIYRQFVSSVVSERLFGHYRVNDLSLYMLINRNNPNCDKLAQMIEERVRKAFCM